MTNLGEIYTQHREGLIGLACRLGCDPSSAEDSVHDIFADLQRAPAKIEAERNVFSWLATRLRWALANQRRAAATTMRGSNAEHVEICEAIDAADSRDTPAQAMDRADVARLLAAFNVTEDTFDRTGPMTTAQRVSLSRLRRRLAPRLRALL